jgi:very-short-patch-repair endonuclease
VDALWPDRRVVLECDGLVKYSDADALANEKKRQEALERAGYRVVRVTWDDVVNNPVETVARVLEALRHGGRGVTYCSL